MYCRICATKTTNVYAGGTNRLVYLSHELIMVFGKPAYSDTEQPWRPLSCGGCTVWSYLLPLSLTDDSEHEPLQ